MLRPVGVDHLKGAVITLEREVHFQDVCARLNDLQDPVCLLHFLVPGGADILHVLINERVLGEHAGLVEEVLHHLEEARVFSLRNGDKALRYSERSCIGGGSVEICRLLNCKGSSSLLKQVAGPLTLPQHLHQAACHISSYCCSTHSEKFVGLQPHQYLYARGYQDLFAFPKCDFDEAAHMGLTHDHSAN